MKKFFATILMSMLLISSVAFAAYTESVEEDADIGSVKRLAIALPMHYKTEDAEPTVEEFTQIMFDASKTSRSYVISYDEIAENIKKDTGVDIKSLKDAELRKTYNENISKYADAFVVVTSANNTKKVQFFFDVFNAKDSAMMYRLSEQGGDFTKDAKGYKKACESFYKRFDSAAEKAIKNAGKKK